MASTSRSRRWILPVVVVLLWLLVGGPLGSFAGKLGQVQENDNAAFLPQSTESTQVLDEFVKFTGQESLPATLVFERDGGLTAQDKERIGDVVADVSRLDHVDASGIAPPVYSDDGTAAQVVVPIVATDGEQITATVDAIRDRLADVPPGLTALVGGQGGFLGDFITAFGAIDGILLLVALAVVLLILLVVYRSPVLPFVVLISSVLGLGVASAVVYAAASNDLLDVNGQSQGILFILAVGAATDYSLLLVARFREELRDNESKYDAMKAAYRGAFEPIAASGLTVILGLLCLLLSDLSSLRGLGPVGALGIAAAMLAALTLLPCAVVRLGRAGCRTLAAGEGSAPGDTRGRGGGVARR
jgi:RND superfamily putative drug exporter